MPVYSDFSGLSDAEDVTVTMSEQTRALLLSALFYLEANRQWNVEAGSSEWDDIQAWLSDAVEQITS
jgi:hypothetical protein